MQERLERVLEDEQPEAGIDEEYRAKNSKLFMWRLNRRCTSERFNLCRSISKESVVPVAEKEPGRRVNG
jgi:hypothetical protein